jgi:hypothetical protein
MHGGSVLTCPDPSVLWRVHAMAAEQKQLADNQRLDEKIDDDVGELRQNASAALAAEKMDIRAQLTSALSVIWGVFDALNTSANSRLDVIQDNVTQVGRCSTHAPHPPPARICGAIIAAS